MGRLTTAWTWWVDGLVDAVLFVERRLGARRRLRLIPVDGGFAIERPNRRRLRRPLRLVADGGGRRLEPVRLARRLAGRDVDVAVADERCVSVRLGPLPAESRGFLGDVVDHRLSRLAPWPRADLVRVFRIEPMGESDPRLVVAVEATSRTALQPIVAAVRATGARRVEAVRLDPDGRTTATFPIGAEEAERRRGPARRIVFALAAVAVLAGLATWRLVDAIDTDAARLEEIDAHVADYRRRLGPAGGGETQALAALARRTPLTVLTLEALSDALPDDTHLVDLTIARDRSSLKGLTRDMDGLSRGLEGSKVFAPPVFTETSVMEADGTRFALDLRAIATEGRR